MRFTYLKGVAKVHDENNLRFACFNMKKMVLHITRIEEQDSFLIEFPQKIIIFIKIIRNLKKATF